jgi:hypothetical protein
MNRIHTDVLVVGGGLGGVAAALGALRAGSTVVLTEEYLWLGGQLTSQAVPLDEHTWIEEFGSTALYRDLRNGIREYYRRWYPLNEKARATRFLNPGAGLVSRICAEPRAAVAVIDALLAPYVSTGRLTIIQPCIPVGAQMHGDRVTHVTVQRVTDDASRTTIEADFVIDATELGDLLPLTSTPYVTGFESRDDTGEPSAPAVAQPANQQAFSWCFVIDHDEGADHTIDRPADYDYWRAQQPDYWGAPMISLTGPDPRTLEVFTRTFTPTIDDDPFSLTADQKAAAGDRELWTFRRILAKKNLVEGAAESDIVLANWPMIDYLGGVIVDVPDAGRHLEAARAQSRAMLYWLQTEAPRPDGGAGWPGLRLRPDVTGTDDGFAMAPYIRESRRIVAEYRITELDLSIEARGNSRPATFPDTVGVGMYRIDLHPSTGGDNYIDVPSVPYEIPLGALIPRGRSNLLAGGKNIGTTHITNGAYRLHPTEWNIGESAGRLAAFCRDRQTTPSAVRNDRALLRAFQQAIEADGVQLHWPTVEGY